MDLFASRENFFTLKKIFYVTYLSRWVFFDNIFRQHDLFDMLYEMHILIYI